MKNASFAWLPLLTGTEHSVEIYFFLSLGFYVKSILAHVLAQKPSLFEALQLSKLISRKI